MSRARDIANLLSTDSPLIDNAPDALNTLNELAAALGDDENFATTVTNSLAGKADTDKFNVPTTNELALRPDGSTEAVRIDSAGNVGIGTTSPEEKVHVVESGTDDAVVVIHQSKYNDATVNAALEFRGWPSSPAGKIVSDRESPYNETTFSRDSNMLFYTANNNADVERLRITREGAVLIGTTSPGSAGAGDLVVNGGVFLGGSAAGNELDDYEEGTWTPTYITIGGTGFSSVTYGVFTSGFYSKIGERVFFTCCLETDAVTVGGASGFVRIDGLPFTATNFTGNGNVGACGVVAENFSTNHPSSSRVYENTTQIGLFYRTTANGADVPLPASAIATGSSDNIVFVSGHYIAA